MRTTPTAALRVRRTAGYALRTRQCGYGVLIALVILVLGSLFGLTKGLSQATAQTKHDDHDQAVLRQAREALVAWAALRPTGPGHLPCPDLDNDGDSEGAACGTASTRIGRLPWKTLQLPDLRDATGERLWYAVSRCFLERPIGTELAVCPNGYRVNSDLRGALTVTGLAPQNEVIAIIFAPGTALGGQNRSAGGTNIAANYLEGENGDAANDIFAALTTCVAADCAGGPFNDKLLVVRAIDLFPVVENMVAKRLETEVAPMLRFYRDRWVALGAPASFPFAVPFANPDPGLPGGAPAMASFCGMPGQAGGLLPVSQDTATCFSWAVAPAAVTETTAPPSFPLVTPSPCAAAPAGEPDTARFGAVKCTITYTEPPAGDPRPSVTISMPVLQKAALALVVADVKHGTSPAYSGTAWGNGATAVDPGTGNVALTYSGNLPPQAPGGPYTVTITIPVYYLPAGYQQMTGVDTSWFFNNDWYRNTYYAVVPQRLPGGAGTCTAGLDCFTVTNLVGTNNDKQAVLVLAGQALNGVTRPNATLANYFEGDNDEAAVAPAAVGTFVRQRRSATFNDKVVVVAP
jgi:hypothetical protein